MLAESKKCTGCGSCSAVCPSKCIVMEEDHEGFRFPIIDHNKCVGCNLCEKACPLIENPKLSEKTIAIAAKNKNLDIRLNSSSGGFFLQLAMQIIQRGGLVCAAKYDENFKVTHTIVDKVQDISPLCGSKYSQSQVEHCFENIKQALEIGRSVVFFGTPCQVSGLAKFLNKYYSNLILVDNICHGVPSPKIWGRYLEERKKLDANGSSVKKVNQRNKSTGWSNYAYSIEIEYENGNRYLSKQSEDLFMKGFTNNLFLRQSCSNCEFKGVDRISDITVGDYWGVWNQQPNFDDDKGVSLLLVHTNKGIEIWDLIKDNFDYMNVNVNEALQNNPSALESSYSHENREKFFKDILKNKSVVKTIEYHLKSNSNQSIIDRMYNHIVHWKRGIKK